MHATHLRGARALVRPGGLPPCGVICTHSLLSPFRTPRGASLLPRSGSMQAHNPLGSLLALSLRPHTAASSRLRASSADDAQVRFLV